MVCGSINLPEIFRIKKDAYRSKTAVRNIIISSFNIKTKKFVVCFIYFTDYTVNKVSLFKKKKSNSTFYFHIFLVYINIISSNNGRFKIRPLQLFVYTFTSSRSLQCIPKKANLCTSYGSWFNPLKTERRLLYLKNQFVPRSKHFSSRL